MSIAANTAITATATQRPGCRTGTARMFSGRPETVSLSDIIEGSTGRAVDHWRGDRAGVVAPLVEDRLIAAVRDHRRERGLDSGCESGSLRDRDAVRRGLVDLTRELDLAGKLFDGIGRDR